MTLPQKNIAILDELGVKLLGKEYSIQYSKNQWHSIKNVGENNYGSKSLHSFWAALYGTCGGNCPLFGVGVPWAFREHGDFLLGLFVYSVLYKNRVFSEPKGLL